MTFLEAKRLLNNLKGGRPVTARFCLSGTPDPLLLYMKAAAAARDVALEIATLPFGTLRQHLLTTNEGKDEILLLCPWDLADALDWRTGGPAEPVNPAALEAEAARMAAALARRKAGALFYLAAPLPPVTTDPAGTAALASRLRALMEAAGAEVIEAGAFGLPLYLASGCPVASAALDRIAETLAGRFLEPEAEPKKILLTDLDNTLWKGLVAEDGLEALDFAPEGPGFRHHIYQMALKRLKAAGILIAAVSRNDRRDVDAALADGRMPIGASDMVAVAAGYGAKSAAIATLVKQLNLGLESAVFVDDNPVEIAEVAAALPAVTGVLFPASEDDLPAFLDRLARLFRKREVTAEDKARTEMYRRMAETAPIEAGQGGDVTGFLKGLEMKLAIRDASTGDRTRAVQLINKTNQFNLNGRRFTDDEVEAMLAAGGKLLTAKLDDKSGSHGEILACLIGADDVMQAIVLSCRVFQRRVEQAFMAWLAVQPFAPKTLNFAETDRNEPLRDFLKDPAFSQAADNSVRFNAAAFRAAHEGDLALMTVTAS